VKERDVVLATGHISADEHYAVVKGFARSGKVRVTHAGEQRGGPRLSPEQCAELSNLGALVEITAMNCQSMYAVPGKSIDEVVGILRAVGPDRCTVSTDYGWASAGIPRPVSGFLEFLEGLWQMGLPEKDLVAMASAVPSRLLELPFA
jgi:hypothetical protein